MKNLIVGCSPITSTLFAGTLRNGLWSKDKQDVTESAPIAVAQHLLQLDQSITFDYKGEKYVLKVEKLIETS